MPCETCRQTNCLRPSAPVGWTERIAVALLGGRHYECVSCGTRQRFPLGPKDPMRQSWLLLSGPSQW
jgi:hypothetical protein